MNTPENTRQDFNHELINIDDAISSYIQKHIAYPIELGGKQIKTSVDYANPERWSKMAYSKEDIDQTELLSRLPIITLNRNNINTKKDKSPQYLPDDVIEYLAVEYSKPSLDPDGRTIYNYKRKPIEISADYSVTIIANHVQHADHLVQQFLLHEGKSWQDSWYEVRVQYNNISNNSPFIDGNQERIIRHNFSMTVDGQISPRNNSNKKVKVQVPSIAKVVTVEKEVTNEEFAKKYGRRTDPIDFNQTWKTGI